MVVSGTLQRRAPSGRRWRYCYRQRI